MSASRRADRVPVVIVGAGPVGLTLALGLSRLGVRSVLVEKEEATSSTSRAPGLHVRTREMLRQWGVEDRFLAAGHLLRSLTLHRAAPGSPPLYSLDFSDLEEETEAPGLLLLEQSRTEAILLEEVRRIGLCEARFGTEACALHQTGGAVRLTVRSGEEQETIEAGFLVGCDGAGSFVRDALGLPFEGSTYSLRPMLADVRPGAGADDLPWPRVWNGRDGFAFAARLPGGLWRLVSIERGTPRGEEVEEAEVSTLATRLLGATPEQVVWASRFRIHLRSAPRFRAGRVLLAGDAAHVHSPALGMGMNAGMQDAHNLAWKLAAALKGGDVDRLLDSYDVERREVVVEAVSRLTDRVTRWFIDAPAPLRAAVFRLVGPLQRLPPLRRASLRRMAMLDLAYPASPLLDARERGAGRRLPDPRVRTPEGPPFDSTRSSPRPPLSSSSAHRRSSRRVRPPSSVG